MSKKSCVVQAFLIVGIASVVHAMERPPKPPNPTKDSPEYYYAPWRQNYRQELPPGCFFCNELGQDHERHLILPLDPPHFYLMISAIPYAQSGTMMIVPHAHIADLQGLTTTLRISLAAATRKIAHLLLRVLGYRGFSVGINTERVAGASIPEHLHIHIIPDVPGNLYPDVAHMLASPAQELQPASASLYPTFRDALQQSLSSEPTPGDDSTHDCYFCRLIAEGNDSIETNLIIVRLEHCSIMFNNHPLIRGHMIIVPYEHQPSPDRCTHQTIVALIEACSKLSGICAQILRNPGSNTGFNVGPRQLDRRPSTHLSMDFVPRGVGDISSLALSNTQVISIDMRRLKENIIKLWYADSNRSQL